MPLEIFLATVHFDFTRRLWVFCPPPEDHIWQLLAWCPNTYCSANDKKTWHSHWRCHSSTTDILSTKGSIKSSLSTQCTAKWLHLWPQTHRLQSLLCLGIIKECSHINKIVSKLTRHREHVICWNATSDLALHHRTWHQFWSCVWFNGLCCPLCTGEEECRQQWRPRP